MASRIQFPRSSAEQEELIRDVQTAVEVGRSRAKLKRRNDLLAEAVANIAGEQFIRRIQVQADQRAAFEAWANRARAAAGIDTHVVDLPGARDLAVEVLVLEPDEW